MPELGSILITAVFCMVSAVIMPGTIVIAFIAWDSRIRRDK